MTEIILAERDLLRIKLKTAIEIMENLRKTYLVEIDSEGNPKCSMMEMLRLWQDVNNYLLHNKKILE